MEKNLHLLSRATMGPTSASLEHLAVAQMAKAELDLAVAAADNGGWDTHTNQGDGESGALFNALGILNDGIQAFTRDLGSLMNRVVILVMTEFGRTANQNGSGDTDHGHGTTMFAIGGDVIGGKVYGQWPGLSSSKLYQGRDLAITTDFRRLFGEILEHHISCKDLGPVFPD